MKKKQVSCGWQKLFDWMESAQEVGLSNDLMRFLLTPEEYESIALRTLLIEDLLLKEKPQRQIAADHQISIAKITRGSNALKATSQELMTFLELQVAKD